MKIKTSELSGAGLDWVVAKCEGYTPHFYGGVVRTTMWDVFAPELNYSTNWAQAGPIIEREGLAVFKLDDTRGWASGFFDGATPLVAAMRCYVASKLGDEVDVPKELIGE